MSTFITPFTTTTTIARTAAVAQVLAVAALVALSSAARAEGDFHHPAVQAAEAAAAGWAQARSAAPRFVGHPASPRWALQPVLHANGTHPALLVAGRTATALDPNTFIVQPPATTQWRVLGDEAIAVAAAGAR